MDMSIDNNFTAGMTPYIYPELSPWTAWDCSQSYYDYSSSIWRTDITTLRVDGFNNFNVTDELTIEKRIPEMKTEKTAHSYSVICDDLVDLNPSVILKNISTIKGKIMLDCMDTPLREIQCLMTPSVKQILVKASKRLAMYGKTRPYRARFDEFGNPLPDEINIDCGKGMTLKIVDPSKYGEHYLEIKGYFIKQRKNKQETY